MSWWGMAWNVWESWSVREWAVGVETTVLETAAAEAGALLRVGDERLRGVGMILRWRLGMGGVLGLTGDETEGVGGTGNGEGKDKRRTRVGDVGDAHRE